MNNLPIIYDLLTQSSVIILVFFAGFSALMAYKFFTLRSAYRSLKSQENKLKDADYVKRRAEKILENAKDKYEQVIQDSYEKAQTIIKDAKVFNEETKQQVLSELGKSIQNITHQIKEETLEDVKGFETELKQEVEVQKTATKRVIEADYDKANTDLAAYKAEQTALIDGKVRQETARLVEQITKEALGHGLDIKNQEELVLKSLENARKQSIL